jgi:hypothetical protein
MKPITHKLTTSESKAFNAFAEERVMAAKGMKPVIKMTRDQEDHLRACFFNCISDAYAAGMSTPNRKKKPEALGIRTLGAEIRKTMDMDKSTKKVMKNLAERVDILAKQYKKSQGGKK